MMKCQTTDRTTCGKPVETALTRFDMFSLSGTFGTNYVFPQIVLSGSQLTPESHYEVGGFQEDVFLRIDRAGCITKIFEIMKYHCKSMVHSYASNNLKMCGRQYMVLDTFRL